MSTAVAKGDRSTREIVHTHAHTRACVIRVSYAHTVFPNTRVPARTFPNGSPLYSSARKHDRQQLQQDQPVGGQQRASLSHEADSSSRRQPRERRSERENRGDSALHRSFDDGASTASAGYGLLARTAVKKAADRRNRALRSRARTQSLHSVDYRRAACCEIHLFRSSLVAAPNLVRCVSACLRSIFPAAADSSVPAQVPVSHGGRVVLSGAFGCCEDERT